MTALRFSTVRKSFGGKLVLDGLDFSVADGEVYGLLGPNGSGKSTAINILSNLLDPDGGAVEIAGKPVALGVGTLVGICPQENVLYRDLYPGENLSFFGTVYGLYGSALRQRVASLMSEFGLGPFARTPISALSGGWQRRVNIAVALVHSPGLLVLDEPSAGLDVEARQELWRMIGNLKQQGMSILLTTHHLDEAEQLCSRMGIINRGRIAKEGTVRELLATVPAEAIAAVEASDHEAIRHRAAELNLQVRMYGGKIAYLLPRLLPLEEVVRLVAGLDVSAISVQRVSLEHAYLEIVRESALPPLAMPDLGVGEAARRAS